MPVIPADAELVCDLARELAGGPVQTLALLCGAVGVSLLNTKISPEERRAAAEAVPETILGLLALYEARQP